MASWIKADGKTVDLLPENGTRFTLKELQEAVGGTVDIIYLPGGEIMAVNDNGKLEGLPMNDEATDIWKRAFPLEKYPMNNDQLVVGDVLFFEVGERGELESEEE